MHGCCCLPKHAKVYEGNPSFWNRPHIKVFLQQPPLSCIVNFLFAADDLCKGLCEEKFLKLAGARLVYSQRIQHKKAMAWFECYRNSHYLYNIATACPTWGQGHASEAGAPFLKRSGKQREKVKGKFKLNQEVSYNCFIANTFDPCTFTFQIH